MNPYYEQDGITIYHGDCREVLPSLEVCDLMLTDPPYGIFAHGGTWGHRDELLWDQHRQIGLRQVLTQSRQQIVWGGNYYAHELPSSRGWLVWWKRDSVPSTADVELAWTSYDRNAKLLDHTIAATNRERLGHPTQKPERVMSWCLSLAPNVQTVLDPFMGSGTTLVAAKRMGKTATGIDINERYCEMAAQRLVQRALPLEMAL
jgi:DNA modification methylase